jgi:hypothetical protein
MRTMLRRLGPALFAGSALSGLAACGGDASIPSAQEVATEAANAAAAATPVSVTVRGSVVDSLDRPIANAHIECLGTVRCAGPYEQVSAEGHGHRVTTTDASGFYHIVATRLSAEAGSGFLMNANRRSYQVEWREVAWPDPACTADEPHCAMRVDFRLTGMAD